MAPKRRKQDQQEDPRKRPVTTPDTYGAPSTPASAEASARGQAVKPFGRAIDFDGEEDYFDEKAVDDSGDGEDYFELEGVVHGSGDSDADLSFLYDDVSADGGSSVATAPVRTVAAPASVRTVAAPAYAPTPTDSDLEDLFVESRASRPVPFQTPPAENLSAFLVPGAGAGAGSIATGPGGSAVHTETPMVFPQVHVTFIANKPGDTHRPPAAVNQDAFPATTTLEIARSAMALSDKVAVIAKLHSGNTADTYYCKIKPAMVGVVYKERRADVYVRHSSDKFILALLSSAPTLEPTTGGLDTAHFNMYREAYVQALLTQLVEENYTHSFLALYATREIEPGNICLFVEPATLSLGQFILQMKGCTAQQLRLWIFSALIQVLFALFVANCALDDYMHMDLHAENVLLTLLPPGSPRVDGFHFDDKTVYIPNAGMRWKIADHGWATSRVFSVADQHTVWGLMRFVSKDAYMPNIAFDVDRLVTSVMRYMETHGDSPDMLALRSDIREVLNVSGRAVAGQSIAHVCTDCLNWLGKGFEATAPPSQHSLIQDFYAPRKKLDVAALRREWKAKPELYGGLTPVL